MISRISDIATHVSASAGELTKNDQNHHHDIHPSRWSPWCIIQLPTHAIFAIIRQAFLVGSTAAADRVHLVALQGWTVAVETVGTAALELSETQDDIAE